MHHFQISADFSITGRDIGIGAVAGLGMLAVGIIGTSYYHPAALEKLKLEQANEEKKKKELADQAEKDRKQAIEMKKLQALNLLLNIKHTYTDEFERIKKEKLHEKDNLLTIIRENYGMQDMPLNQYYTQLVTNIESLKYAENVLPAESQQERLTFVTNLERVFKVYNNQISDKAKQEKDIAENKHQCKEAEQRKIEKEKLDAQKLRLEIDTAKSIPQELNRLSEHANEAALKFSEIGSLIHHLKAAVARLAQEFKQTTTKNQEKTELLIDQVRQYISHLIDQQQQKAAAPQQAPPPPYNPAYMQQIQAQLPIPFPAPSAPPMNR